MALTARTAALWEKEKRSREGDGPVSSWLAVVVVELECRQQVSGVFRVFTSLLNASRWNEGQSKGRLVPFVVTLVQENVYKSPLSLSLSLFLVPSLLVRSNRPLLTASSILDFSILCICQINKVN